MKYWNNDIQKNKTIIVNRIYRAEQKIKQIDKSKAKSPKKGRNFRESKCFQKLKKNKIWYSLETIEQHSEIEGL